MRITEILEAVADLHSREGVGEPGPGVSMAADGVAYAFRAGPRDADRPGAHIRVELWRHDMTLAWTGPASHVPFLSSPRARAL